MILERFKVVTLAAMCILCIFHSTTPGDDRNVILFNVMLYFRDFCELRLA